MDDGERNGSDSDDGSSASWVILNDDDHISEGEDSLATAGVEPPAPAPAPAPAAADSQPPAPAMDSSGESAKTVVERTDVSAGAETSGAAPPATARVEEGSDIEVIPAEHTDDVFFEDDPMDLTVDVSEDSSSETVRVMGALPSETVLRQRRGRGAAAQDNAEDRGVDRDQTRDQTRDQEEDQREDQKEGPEAGALPHRSAVQPVPPDSDRDRWADDTDLSTLTDQMVLDEADAGRLRQYVHQRNNTVNHLLTVVLVLCVTCVLGLGVGHFLGWLHHHEMTEEIVHTLDEKLDVLRDDLMTCMTTEDDQDLDNKWIKELLTENEALLQQLHGEEEQSGAEGGSHCSEAGYARLRDQVNQLRMENDELKANIAKMRYGTTSQDGYVLRRHRDKINQLVTENGELARELRRTRYLQPPAGITDQEDDPAPSAGQLPTVTESERGTDSDSDSAGDSPEFLAPAAYQADSSDSADSAYSNDDSEASFTTFSDSDSDSADSDYGSAGSTSDSTDDDSSADEGLLAALLSWRPAPGSVPLQEARHRLWSLWQEASDFSRAEPASKYVHMAGKTLAKVEKTLLKAMHKVQQFGEDMMQDDDVGGGRMEKVAGKLGRKVGKVVAKLDARWQEIRRNWEGKVAAREAQTEQETKREPAGEPERPAGLPPNASDPSVAAYYARRSRHRQHARGEDAAGNWQMERGKSRAEIRGAFHGASWLLERAQARQQLRQRRGEEAPVPPVDQRWRQERAGRRGEEAPRTDGGWRHEQQQQQRHEWNAAEDDDDRDDDDDDDDDDYEDHAARLARHMAASARFHDRIQKTVHRHAAKIDRKVRENHWKHFGGRNRHEFRERGQKY